MNALTFTIELLEPMLATGLEGDPNAGVSMQHIAGSVLRGAVIGLWLRENKHENDLANNQRELFFSEEVCFLNSYPLVKNKRSLPIPLSWHKEKDASENDGDGFLDFCFAQWDESKQYKGLSAKFFAFDGSIKIIKAEVDTRIAVHNRRNPQKGRAVKKDGDIFRYESVAPKTKFRGVVISENVSLLEAIKPLIDGKEVMLGGSRTAGYGRAKVICDEKLDDHWNTNGRGETKRAIRKIVQEIEKEKVFTITLLSNALVRDANGQFQVDLTAEHLGVDATLCESKSFKRAELIGGFNRKWGLPLPQQLSIKAGSVFTFKAKQDIDESTIKIWLDHGIGERRLDGFGRVAVNLNKDKEAQLWFGRADKDESTSVALQSERLTTIARIIVDRVLRQRLDSKLIAQVGLHKIEKAPPNSQISRLRLLLREVLRKEKGIDAINQFFTNLKKPAREHFETARVYGGGSPKGKLKDWVISVAAETSRFIEAPVFLGNDQGKVEGKSDNLQQEYNLRLIDGVLARAAKDNQ